MNISSSPVVAGIDGSRAAAHAGWWAAAEAANHGAPLRLVHAVAPPAEFGPDYLDALETQGQRYLADTKRRIESMYPELDISAETRFGAAVPALVAESRTARLVVTGARGLGGYSGMRTGSVALGLLAHARCPVVLTRLPGQGQTAQGPIVVGVTESSAGDAAVELGFEAASIRKAPLVAVHAWAEFGSDLAFATARSYTADWTVMERHAREAVLDILGGWQRKYPDVLVRPVLTCDRPARQLLEHATKARLLVVGNHADKTLPGKLLGGTIQALAHHAPCPLLVTRAALR